MIPGSTGIVVDVTPMEGAYAPEVPDRQLGFGLNGMGLRSAFADKLSQKRIHGNAPPPGFISKAGFGFARNLDTHGAALCSDIVANYSRPWLKNNALVGAYRDHRETGGQAAMAVGGNESLAG